MRPAGVLPILLRGTAHVVVVVPLLLLAGRAEGRDDESGPLSVRLAPVRGPVATGRLAALGDGRLLVEAPQGDVTLDLGSVRRLQATHPPAPQLAGRPHLRVKLVGGEVVLGTWGGAIEDGFVLDTPELGRLPLRLEAVRAIVPVEKDAGPCHEPELRYRAGTDDRAYVHSGDSYSGIVLALDDEGLEIETEGDRLRRVGWNDLAVLHLQNDDVPEADGVVVEIETVEGAQLVAAADVALEGAHVVFSLRSLPDRRLRIPATSLFALGTRGGAFDYASDLPFESEFTPYYGADEESSPHLARWYRTRRNRRPSGCPLRLDGTIYRHGFAVHARARVTIATGGRYTSFASLFGVDDEAAEVDAGGIVDARVLGDGEVLWQKKDVRAGAPPVRVGPLDVAGVEELVLEVDFGAEQHVRDRATWADPVLVRK